MRAQAILREIETAFPVRGRRQWPRLVAVNGALALLMLVQPVAASAADATGVPHHPATRTSPLSRLGEAPVTPVPVTPATPTPTPTPVRVHGIYVLPPTPTPVPTLPPTVRPTVKPTPTPTATPSATPTPTPSATPTATPTPTPTPSGHPGGGGG